MSSALTEAMDDKAPGSIAADLDSLAPSGVYLMASRPESVNLGA